MYSFINMKVLNILSLIVRMLGSGCNLENEVSCRLVDKFRDELLFKKIRNVLEKNRWY